LALAMEARRDREITSQEKCEIGDSLHKKSISSARPRLSGDELLCAAPNDALRKASHISGRDFTRATRAAEPRSVFN